MKNQIQSGQQTSGSPRIGGVAGWLLARLSSHSRPQPGLVVRERITLAPRQTLSLVEADGRRLLIATSPEGTPAFYALDDSRSIPRRGSRSARVSW